MRLIFLLMAGSSVPALAQNTLAPITAYKHAYQSFLDNKLERSEALAATEVELAALRQEARATSDAYLAEFKIFSELQKERSAFPSRIRAHQERISALRDEHDAAIRDFETRNSLNLGKTDIDSIVRRAAESKARLEALQVQIKDLRERLIGYQKNKEYVELMRKKKNLESTIESLEDLQRTLAAKVKSTETGIRTTEQTIKDNENDVAAQEIKRASFERDVIAAVKKEIASDNAELVGILSVIRGLDTRIQVRKNSVAARAKQVADLRRRQSEIQAMIKKLREDAADIDTQIAQQPELQKAAHALTSQRIPEAEIDLAAKTAEARSLAARVKQAQEALVTHDKGIAAIQSTLKDLNERRAREEATFASLVAEEKKLNNEVQSQPGLGRQLAQLQNKLARLNQSLVASNKTIQSLESTIEKLNAKFKGDASKRDQLLSKVSSFENRRASLDRQIRSNSEEIRDLKRRVAEIESAGIVTRVRTRRLREWREKIRTLDSENQRHIGDRRWIISQLKEAERDLERISPKSDQLALRKANASLEDEKKKVEDLKSDIVVTQKALAISASRVNQSDTRRVRFTELSTKLIPQARKRIETLTQTTRATQAESVRLTAARPALEQQFSKIGAEYNAANKKSIEAQNVLNGLRNQLNGLTERIGQVPTLIRRRDDTLRRASFEVQAENRIQGDIQSLLKITAGEEDDIAGLNRQRADADNKAATLKAVIEGKNRDLANKTAALERMVNTLAQTRDRIQKEQGNLVQLKAELAKTIENQKKSKTDKAQAEKRLSDLETSVDAFYSRYSQPLINGIAARQRQVSEIESEANLLVEFSERLKEYRKNIEDSEKEIRRLEARNEALRAELNDKDKAVSELKRAADEADSRLKYTQQTRDNQAEALKEVAARLKAVENELERSLRPRR